MQQENWADGAVYDPSGAKECPGFVALPEPRLPFGRGWLRVLYPMLSELWQLLDIVAVACALALTVRWRGADFGQEHQLLFGITAALMLLVYSWSDLFYRLRTRSLGQECGRLLQAWMMVIVLVIAGIYLVEGQLPRDFVVTWGTVSYGLQLVVHVGVRKTLHFLRRRGYNIRHALMVGCGAPLERNVRLLNHQPWLGINVVGYVAEPAWLARQHPGAPAVADGLRWLGRLDDIPRLVEELSVSEIYVTMPIDRAAEAEQAVRALVNIPVSVNWLPDFSVAHVLSTRTDELGGQPIVLLSDSRIERHGVLFKRAEDLVLSAILIALLSPVMMAIALAIKLGSRGPVFFKQQRLGMGGQKIEVWKFRTMRTAVDGEAARQATRGDERVTPIGAWLRRWSLDELPQLFNVWQGTMSLMGPRPHPLWLNDRFSQVVHAYMQRHRVKPGITGWAQVNGYRGETETSEKMHQRVKYDLYYITHWSPWLDLKILLRTLTAVVRGDNAY